MSLGRAPQQLQLHRQMDSRRKHTTGFAGLVVKVNANGRPIKRRASKACEGCRARKVRCNVVDCGVPCTNCTLDEVPCVVTKSKWRKELRNCGAQPLEATLEDPQMPVLELSGPDVSATVSVSNLTDIATPAIRRASDADNSVNDLDDEASLDYSTTDCLNLSQIQERDEYEHHRDDFCPIATSDRLFSSLLNSASFCGDRTSSCVQPSSTPPSQSLEVPLPAYIKPMPQRITADDVQYLWLKGALSIPETILRNELIRCYIEYVHPYMPSIELHEFLRIIDQNTGETGGVSLLLFQAVMFAGTAFVDMALLETAGYMTRRAARKAFYRKVRLIYDADYEVDHVALVQSLLLMTLWCETPDDQKDTWHWMGIATSLAYTAGLNRNVDTSSTDIEKHRLGRRIWWSCFIRDRIISLGLGRPTRIKDEDYDVPMLALEDFEIKALSTNNFSRECTLIKDTTLQTDLAMMCIAKAKLCECMGYVLSEYCDLVRDQGTTHGQHAITDASYMLSTKKMHRIERIQLCDIKLAEWVNSLPVHCLYTTSSAEEFARAGPSFVVQRALLHMAYFSAVSTLNRLQVQPSTGAVTLQKYHYLQAMSSSTARKASRDIGKISLDLLYLRLERFLPTSSLSFLLQAIMIHLRDLKSLSGVAREEALQGFYHCAQVLEKLRDNYAAADYATRLIEAAMRKAELDVEMGGGSPQEVFTRAGEATTIVQNVSQLIDAGKAAKLARRGFHSSTIPPPNDCWSNDIETESEVFDHFTGGMNLDEEEIDWSLDSLLSVSGACGGMDSEWGHQLPGMPLLSSHY